MWRPGENPASLNKGCSPNTRLNQRLPPPAPGLGSTPLYILKHSVQYTPTNEKKSPTKLNQAYKLISSFKKWGGEY